MKQDHHLIRNALWFAQQKASLDELSAAGGALWWLQNSPDDGTTRLMRCSGADAPVPVTPPGLSIGGWLHSDGGGFYALGAEDTVWFINGADSGLYRLNTRTGRFDAVLAGDGFVYGDLYACAAGVLVVRGTEDGDELVLVGRADGAAQVLIQSTGFLGTPRLLGNRLAFLEWDDDQMPWDGSRLLVARLGPDGMLEQPKIIAGGAAESVVQPAWGPDGELYYLSDRSGWWNLYSWDGARHRPAAPMMHDCAPAPWEGGYQSYTFMADGRAVLTVHDGLSHRLMAVAAGGALESIDTPLATIKPYLATDDDRLIVIGSSSAEPPAVFSVIPKASAASALTLIYAPTQTTMLPGEPRQLAGVDGLRYLLHRPPVSGPVPLIVRAHAGPTDEVRDRLDWTKQYFLAHGFAIAEVAYRGSAGLGRAFRTSLNGRWGTYDVEDCLAVAYDLLADRVATPGAVFLSGSSAGGYTALQAACVENSPLTAVTAISAIIDPVRWAETAPRFQRPHARVLAGPAGAARADQVRIPVLLMHGRSDEVAPAADAENLAAELRAQDPRHEALFFDGVGHYLTSPTVLAEALRLELAFYRRFIG